MPAPEKAKKPVKKLDKDKGGKKGLSSKKKAKGSGNLLLILSGVGVVVLIAVGITIFMLMSGDSEQTKKVVIPTMTAKELAQMGPGGGVPGGGAAGAGQGGGATIDLGELTTKLNDLIDKLADAAKSDESGKQLKELLDSDAVNKAPGGRNLVLNTLKDKAQAGNDGAKQFLLKLSKDTSNAALAQAAKKLYDDNLRQPGEKETAMDADAGSEPTEFLPNKVDVVFSMKMNKFIESEYNKGVFNTGAFRKEDIDKRLGIPANTIDQIVLGGMKDFNQVVGIIRTNAPYNWDEIKRTMKLEESGNTIKGKTYYVGQIDFLTEFLGQRMPGIDGLRSKAAFWRVDVKTLIYADETTMKDLLENPPEKDKASAPPPSTAGVPSGNPGGVGSDIGGAVAGGNRGGDQGGGSGASTLGGAPGGGGGGGATSLGSAGGDSGGATTGGAPPVPGGAGGSGSTGTTKAVEPSRPERFLTIDAKMRRLIRLTEDSKNDSLVIFSDKATSKVPVLVNYVTYLDRLPSVRSREIDLLVFALPVSTGSPSLRVGVACKSRNIVREVTSDIEKLLAKLGKEDMRDLFGFDFNMVQATVATEGNQGGGAGGIGLTGGGGGGGVGSALGGGDTGSDIGGATAGGNRGGGGRGVGITSGGGGGGSDVAGAGGRGIVSGGGGGGVGSALGNSGGGGQLGGKPGGGGAGSGLMGSGLDGGGGAGQQGEGQAASSDVGGSFTIERSEEYIIITATVKSSLSDFIEKHMKSWMQQVRGSQEMASGKFRFGDLTSSLEFYKADLTRNNRAITFPQGAYPRAYDAERGSRPYPPRERISFFRELLPYLGDDRYFQMRELIDGEKSWRDPHNLQYGRIVVPHFLNPSAGPSSAYVKVRDVDQPLATTHFVGMAGVGPDAAYLPKSDPRAGIFGYDRVTSPDDIKDGLSNTIYMIEADKALLGPWLAGGGSTVRGTSLAGNDVGRRGGFTSPNYSGKAGVWVMMADGSARFLSKDVSPEVFKALCTMNGSDSAGAIDLIASKVNLEVTPRTEVTTALPVAKKKKIVEEEEVPVKK